MSLTKATFAMIDGATVNVLDFGATGDGVTDDADSIIAALNSLGANGGTLFFPAGTYMVGKVIPIKRGVHYLGESPYSTVVKATAASWDNIFGYGYPSSAQAAQERDFIFENLTIDGNKANRTENQLSLQGTGSGIFIDGETVTSSSGGTAICSVHNEPVTFIGLEPGSIVGTFNVGNVVTGQTSGATLTIASKAPDDAWQISMRCQSAQRFRITNCIFRNSFYTALSVYNNCVEGTIDNCQFYDNNKAGTVLSSPYVIFIESYGRNLMIFNNIIDNNPLGSSIVVRGGILSAIKIIGNSITNSGNYGIEIQSSVQGGNGVASDIHVIGNRLYLAPNGGEQLTIIGQAAPAVLRNIVVSGNTFDTGAVGVGIRGNVDTISVVNNAFKEMTTAPIIVAGILGAGSPSKYNLFGNVTDSTDANFQYINASINGTTWIAGSGSPEGVVFASVGALYSRTNGGAGTSFYVKESGTNTNTGWVAK